MYYTGDHIQAVDGQSILSVHYDEALRLLKETGDEVELVLSQANRGQDVPFHTPNTSINYTAGETSGIKTVHLLHFKCLLHSGYIQF